MGYVSPWTEARIIENKALKPASSLRKQYEDKGRTEAAQAIKAYEQELQQRIDALRRGW